jgi:transglutaminase-like putative cysteine protease
MIENIQLQKFLLGTKYCDTDNAIIRLIARELSLPRKGDDVYSAVQIFNWVRDEVKYNFDYWNVKASDTLMKMSGMCANKANLQIAMLRSIGIPAGYMVLRIKKDALKVIAINEIFDKSLDVIIHVYCCVMLNGEWVGADATVDRELYESAYAGVPDWDYVEWDGYNHIHISDNFITYASGPYTNLDEYMDMPHRFLNEGIMERANSHIERLRAKAKTLIVKI